MTEITHLMGFTESETAQILKEDADMTTKPAPQHTPTQETQNEMVEHLESVLRGRSKPAFANDEIPRILKAVNAYEGLMEQHGRDSQTLAEYAKEKNDLRERVRADQKKIKALVEAGKAGLYALENMPDFTLDDVTPAMAVAMDKLREALRQAGE